MTSCMNFQITWSSKFLFTIWTAVWLFPSACFHDTLNGLNEKMSCQRTTEWWVTPIWVLSWIFKSCYGNGFLSQCEHSCIVSHLYESFHGTLDYLTNKMSCHNTNSWRACCWYDFLHELSNYMIKKFSF